MAGRLIEVLVSSEHSKKVERALALAEVEWSWKRAVDGDRTQFKVFAPVGGVDAVLDPIQASCVDAQEFRVVVLANVGRLSAERVASLEEYVAAGGGLIVALGDQAQFDVYNDLLYRNGMGLLPAGLSRIEEVQSGDLRVGEAARWAKQRETAVTQPYAATTRTSVS